MRVAVALGGWKLAAPALIAAFLALLLVGLFASASAPTAGARQVCEVRGLHGEIPANYVPWLQRAAAKYKLGPRGFSIVAAVHYVESDFGRSPLPGVAPGTQNYMGAQGPGQFLVPSWEAYGAALFTYNHADWYVNKILAQAESYQGEVSCRLVGTQSAPLALGNIDWTDTSGPWGGAKKFADLAAQIARRHGCTVVSAKRSTEATLSGGVSDHWVGATHSYAVDLDACDLSFPGGAADQAARDIAAAFDLPGHTGVISAYRGRYRIQLLWQTYVGGNHYNHVHVGVRNICCAA